ncbi:MAG: bifunctional demethylmenaquinone methyltransferase/2-methoxy-6-polyprenyl-1,4-benzoquinol methylase UbiE [Bacteroides sp.]|nr:bifunctional demethylmenaquinone methyltransferase/2-methoxy-6-polyprenyl-1,4-benzoquinol methylase UbiE [Bacteroides sp.]MCM1379091.1 bifunctional demethylmenaquinone methyltransferase/2-methoxy-6-polyprenyl-1,4-benzoquinol methylase UbiE [Bacteroides sp.]MCM1445789.1 bifunctional demethylmenaquinone methyltransferase/2-methoxy-6-polyprenyl-1,4-benzoquinol methylase UbiE [Prevotella sp.]
MADVEKITPYGSDAPKEQQVEAMFDSIAPAYDLMNRAMTFGIDRLWRAKAVGMLRREGGPSRILDIATGTGDLAILLARKLPGAHITGVDLSAGMLAVGREKVTKAGLTDRISFSEADCLALPFADGEFDCITVAYGVRNFANLEAGYREMRRVLRPGGTLCVIELSTPVNPLIKPLYRFYTRTIIPAVGRMVSKDSRAYSYLPESIAAVAQREQMTALMQRAGFSHTFYRPLTFGVCTIYLGS